MSETLGDFARFQIPVIPENYKPLDQIGLRKNVFSYSYFEIDLCVSALQKSIRRGLQSDTIQWINELFYSSVACRTHLWNRLLVISLEDIGISNPSLILYGYDIFKKHRDDIYYAVHFGILLCNNVKNRLNDLLLHYGSSNKFESKIEDFITNVINKNYENIFKNYYFLKEDKKILKQLYTIIEKYYNNCEFFQSLKELAFSVNWKYNAKSDLVFAHLINIICFDKLEEVKSENLNFKKYTLHNCIKLQLYPQIINCINRIGLLGIPEWTADKHTRLGKILNRDNLHFWFIGVHIENADSKYKKINLEYYNLILCNLNL
jgi:hypothetical protein